MFLNILNVNIEFTTANNLVLVRDVGVGSGER